MSASVAVGEYRFAANGTGFVEVSNGKADGRDAIDGVRWVYVGE